MQNYPPFNTCVCAPASLVGTSYGKGVYFAPKSSYSVAHFGLVDPNGHKHIYQVRVLTGLMTQGRSDLVDPPPKDPAKPNVKYDSVCDNPANPAEIVIFSDTQAYPEYHITYQWYNQGELKTAQKSPNRWPE